MLDRKADTVTIEGAGADWVEQRQPGGRVTAYFGTAGWLDVSSDRVRVRNRFLGWANFIFDINSPFFGLSAGQVVEKITSADRIDPKMSNLALAWNNILYNSSWQHLDVWTKLLQTIVMAFMGTLLAVLVAFPLSFIAARNITRNRPVNQLTKRFFDFVRSVDMLIWALFFTRAFGPDRWLASRPSSSPIPARLENFMPKRWRTSTTSSARASSRSAHPPWQSSASASCPR